MITPERPVTVGGKVIRAGKFEIRLKETESEDLPVSWMVVDKTN